VGWQQAATCDLEQLRTWWKQFNGCNFGVSCSESGVFVLDVDPRHGGDGTLADLERQHGPLPETWRFITGGGGEHILFRDAGIELDLRNSASKLGRGLDCRGRGGLIVAPGSRHESGRSYSINVDFHPDDVPLADVPAWIIGALSAKTYEPGAAAAKWRSIAHRDIIDGERNETLARITGHVLRRHVDPDIAVALIHAFNKTQCTPPLDTAEVDQILRSIAAKEARRIRTEIGGKRN
jgi:hypothetical protein